MNMLRALNVLKKDLKEKENKYYRLYNKHILFEYYGYPVKGRIIHFYGMPDCCKTSLMRDIINCNHNNSFIYISKNKDNIAKMKNYNNCSILMSNIFEDTIEYLSKIEPNTVDYVIIDDIHNMLSREELKSAFTKKLDEHTIFNNYIKRLSMIAANKHIVMFITNGINMVSKKSRYGYMIDKEAVASFEIQRVRMNDDYATIKIIPFKNLMSEENEPFKKRIDWRFL